MSDTHGIGFASRQDGRTCTVRHRTVLHVWVALPAHHAVPVVPAVPAHPPALPGWRTFFEEPAMLLGVVLVGRALEERAKLQASADMAALQVGG